MNTEDIESAIALLEKFKEDNTLHSEQYRMAC
jgi:hypothetical protein